MAIDKYALAAMKFGLASRKAILADCRAVGFSGPVRGGTICLNGETVKLPDIDEASIARDEAYIKELEIVNGD